MTKPKRMPRVIAYEALLKGPATTGQIIKMTGLDNKAAWNAVYNLKKAGKVIKEGNVYRVIDEALDQVQPTASMSLDAIPDNHPGTRAIKPKKVATKDEVLVELRFTLGGKQAVMNIRDAKQLFKVLKYAFED